MRYQIAVKTIQGMILTFSTNEYRVEDGFVVWTDFKTGDEKKFAVSNCEITSNGGWK
jgi:hypothetical protein